MERWYDKWDKLDICSDESDEDEDEFDLERRVIAGDTATIEELKRDGNEAFKAEKWAKAESLYSRAISKLKKKRDELELDKPKISPLLLPDSVLKKMSKKNSESLKTLQRDMAVEAAASRNPETIHLLYTNRSNVRHKLKRYHAAIKDAKKAQESKANWFKPYYREGLSCLEVGLYTRAVAAFRKGLRLAPKSKLLKKKLEEAYFAEFRGSRVGKKVPEKKRRNRKKSSTKTEKKSADISVEDGDADEEGAMTRAKNATRAALGEAQKIFDDTMLERQNRQNSIELRKVQLKKAIETPSHSPASLDGAPSTTADSSVADGGVKIEVLDSDAEDETAKGDRNASRTRVEAVDKRVGQKSDQDAKLGESTSDDASSTSVVKSGFLSRVRHAKESKGATGVKAASTKAAEDERRVSLLDIVAAFAWSPKSGGKIGSTAEALCFEVVKKERRGREFRLFLDNDRGTLTAPEKFDQTAPSERASQVLFCRVLSMCEAQPINTSAVLAMHALLSGAIDGRTRQLYHFGSRVVDYGLCLGSVRGVEKLVLVMNWKKQSDPSKWTTFAQNPDRHEWIYLKLDDGTTWYLDLSAEQFGETPLLVPHSPKVVHSVPGNSEFAPANAPANVSSPVLLCPATSASRYGLAQSIDKAQIAKRMQLAERTSEDALKRIVEAGTRPGATPKDLERMAATAIIRLYRHSYRRKLRKHFS
eukprot:g3366.t1